MKPNRSSPPADPVQAETQQQLLDAAQAVFAEVGFHDATIRRICERAGANIAAVHYHFGDQQTLYQAVMRQACLTATARYPLYHHCRPAIHRLFPEVKFGEADIERIAEHIARFSFLAIKELSRGNKSSNTKGAH